MASGEFSWLIGNDDLVTPDSFETLNSIINSNLDKDYFYINSYHMSSNFFGKISKTF